MNTVSVRLSIVIFVLFLCFLSSYAQTPLNRYIPYEVVAKSDTFQVRVNGQEVFVAWEECFGDSTLHTSQFYVDGLTQVEIICSSPIISHAIRPYHKKIEGQVSDYVPENGGSHYFYCAMTWK
ncbi:MAG: hypothetical protein ACFB15_26770 [Cyclobacteriaceae bacterium]